MNTIGVESIKTFLNEGKILTVGVNSDTLDKFNHKTGLIEKANVPAAIESLSQKPNHSLALLGYDDALYEGYGFKNGTGAFIVKNTWDSDFHRDLVSQKISPEEKGQLASFRNKISSKNLTGYYAIPYQFFWEIIDIEAKNKDATSSILYSHPIPSQTTDGFMINTENMKKTILLTTFRIPATRKRVVIS